MHFAGGNSNIIKKTLVFLF